MAQSVETDQGKIVYSVSGTGPPLVLLPGFMSNRTGWLAPTNYLDLLDDYTVVNIDPLGHGKSALSHDASDYTAQPVVDHVIRVLDECSPPAIGLATGNGIHFPRRASSRSTSSARTIRWRVARSSRR